MHWSRVVTSRVEESPLDSLEQVPREGKNVVHWSRSRVDGRETTRLA